MNGEANARMRSYQTGLQMNERLEKLTQANDLIYKVDFSLDDNLRDKLDQINKSLEEVIKEVENIVKKNDLFMLQAWKVANQ